MAKRWNVHHGNDNLGLKTAKEIREALRKGTLDPFDKVSAEGSNIREDLIEVDEIFKETIDEVQEYEFTSVQQMPIAAQANAQAQRARPQMQAPQPAAQARPALKDPIPRGNDPDQPRTNSPQPAPVPGASWRNNVNGNASANGAQGAPAPQASDADSKESKSTQKRYYLIDKSKILGPLSALEIQSLFNRSLLNQKVKVQRIGGTRSIPVAQFIASYSEDRLKELTDDGKLNQKANNPSSKVLNELARVANAQKIAKTRQNKTYMIVGIAGLIIGALIFIIFEATRSSPTKRGDTREETSERSDSKRSRPKLLQSQGQVDDDDDDDRAARIARKPRPVPIVKKVEKVKEKEKEREPAPVEIRDRRVPLARTPITKKAAPVSPPVPVRAPSSPPTPAPVAKVAPKAAPTPPPVAQAPVKKESPIARALAASGRGIQTIGPLSFSPGALESCASKCTLTLKDASGATIKAVFFKSAYYDALKKASNGVFLTGNTRKESGELTIFIQDVR